MKTKKILIALVILISVFTSYHFLSAQQVGAPCNNDSQCPSGFICNIGYGGAQVGVCIPITNIGGTGKWVKYYGGQMDYGCLCVYHWWKSRCKIGDYTPNQEPCR